MHGLPRPRRRALAVVLLLLPLLAGAPARAQVAPPPASGAEPAWVAAWTASPTASTASSAACPGTGGVTDRTLRNLVFTSAGGDRVRVRFTNAFGTRPLQIGAASVAVAASTTSAATVPGTLRTLTFGGQRSVAVPAGQDLRSDPVELTVAPHSTLAVSLHVPESGPTSIHRFTYSRSFSSVPGDHSADTSATPFTQATSCWVNVDAVDVSSSRAVAGTVMALGDSITDGANTTTGTNQRWPDLLGRRLTAQGGPVLSVGNAGLVGNQVTLDREPVTFGRSAVSRLDRDVLSHSGVRLLIVLEGINDIGTREATPAQVIAGYEEIIARAHANGVKVVGATLTPSGGATRQFPTYASAETERDWRTINTWIRTSGAFDGVLDFAAAVADPADDWLMARAYDSGDGLHPGDAGMRRLADSIDLELLRRLLEPGTWFDELEDDLAGYDDVLPAHVSRSLGDRLQRAASAADAGSEKSAVALLEQFVARARNQVRGDAQDATVSADLVAQARELIAFLQRLDDVEDGLAVVRVPR